MHVDGSGEAEGLAPKPFDADVQREMFAFHLLDSPLADDVLVGGQVEVIGTPAVGSGIQVMLARKRQSAMR